MTNFHLPKANINPRNRVRDIFFACSARSTSNHIVKKEPACLPAFNQPIYWRHFSGIFPSIYSPVCDVKCDVCLVQFLKFNTEYNGIVKGSFSSTSLTLEDTFVLFVLNKIYNFSSYNIALGVFISCKETMII